MVGLEDHLEKTNTVPQPRQKKEIGMRSKEIKTGITDPDSSYVSCYMASGIVRPQGQPGRI